MYYTQSRLLVPKGGLSNSGIRARAWVFVGSCMRFDFGIPRRGLGMCYGVTPKKIYNPFLEVALHNEEKE